MKTTHVRVTQQSYSLANTVALAASLACQGVEEIIIRSNRGSYSTYIIVPLVCRRQLARAMRGLNMDPSTIQRLDLSL